MLGKLICLVAGHQPFNLYSVEGVRTSVPDGEEVRTEWNELVCPRCGYIRASGVDVEAQ
jgi:hypothetical protein